MRASIVRVSAGSMFPQWFQTFQSYCHIYSEFSSKARSHSGSLAWQRWSQFPNSSRYKTKLWDNARGLQYCAN